MKLIYISPLRYPSEKAGSQFSMQSCEAFANEGVAVELWAPRRWNQFGGEDPFLFHGVKRNFRIVTLPAIDLSPVLPLFFFLLSFSFAIAAIFYALMRREKNVLYYSHEPFALFLLTFVRGRTVYEIHDFPGGNGLFRWLFRRLNAAVTTNQWKKKELVKRFSFDADRILAIPNAVDVRMFAIGVSKNEARRKLNLPDEKKIILYTGHLFDWKGVDTLLEAARRLQEGNFQFPISNFQTNDLSFYIVGGTDEDIEKFKSKVQSAKSKIQNAVIAGRRPHEEIPLWLRAADVLVLPNTAREDISKYYTSPVKLFEYMASGTPIVASDLPSIREIVSENEVCFVKPDDPKSLFEGVAKVLSDENFACEIARSAALRSEKYTWPRRAKQILSWLAPLEVLEQKF